MSHVVHFAAARAAPDMRSIVIGGALLCMACGIPPAGPRTEVTIPDGSSLDAVAESLAVYGVVRTARSFVWFAKMSGDAEAIAPGVYYLEPGVPMGEVLATLVEGPSVTRFSVKAGYWIPELAVLVEQHLDIPGDSFLAAASSEELRERVGARGATLEGYLYPGTHYIPLGASATDVVEQMVGEFERRWSPTWNARLDTLGWTRDELVTLASIIEGEVRHDEDRDYVSSVYHNRLEAGIRLQADPTVVYALGIRRRLYNRDYRVQSPYNTYVIKGLPPHPINQPNKASLEAALYPTETDFMYFVAGRDGRHVFSRSYREHLASISRIRGARRDNVGTR